MGIKTVPQSPYSWDLAPGDFWLFPKLRGCRYETIEEMKEAVRKVIDMLTLEDFHGTFQKLLERYNKCIAARGDYFEGDWSLTCVLSIKVPVRKKSGNLSYAPRISSFVWNVICLFFRDMSPTVVVSLSNAVGWCLAASLCWHPGRSSLLLRGQLAFQWGENPCGVMASMKEANLNFSQSIMFTLGLISLVKI